MGREHDDLVDVVAAAGLIGRADHSELRHVTLEPVGLLARQRSPVHAVALGLDEKLIVDVGHVAAHLDRRPSQPEHPGSDVGPHEGGRVADVGRLIRSDATHVHPGTPENRHWGIADAKRGRRTERGVRGHAPRRHSSEPAGDTIDVGSDDHSRHDTPVRRPWTIALPSLFASTLRDQQAVD